MKKYFFIAPTMVGDLGITSAGMRINADALDAMHEASTCGTYIGNGKYSTRRYYECETVPERYKKTEVSCENDYLLANLLVRLGKLEPNATVNLRGKYSGIRDTAKCFINDELMDIINEKSRPEFELDEYYSDYDEKSHLVFDLNGQTIYTRMIHF